MPSITTPKIHPKPATSTHLDTAITNAAHAVDAATVGRECVGELRSILHAIVALSRGHDIVHELAQTGYNLANSQHNLLDVMREDNEHDLLTLQGVNHG